MAEALTCVVGPHSHSSSSSRDSSATSTSSIRNGSLAGATVKEKPFGSLQADDIEEVQIKSADGETTRLQKTDGKWQVVEPVKTDADTSELTTIASSLATFEINRVVDENATI